MPIWLGTNRGEGSSEIYKSYLIGSSFERVDKGKSKYEIFVFCFVHMTVAHTHEMRKNNMKPIRYIKVRS